MHKIAGKYMEAWNNAIREDERAVESLKSGTKRAIHLVKVEEEDLEDIESAWRNNSLEKVSSNSWLMLLARADRCSAQLDFVAGLGEVSP